MKKIIKEINKEKKEIKSYIFFINKTIENIRKAKNLMDYYCIFCIKCDFLRINKNQKRCYCCYTKFKEIYNICHEFGKNSVKILRNKKIVISKLKHIINKKLKEKYKLSCNIILLNKKG